MKAIIAILFISISLGAGQDMDKFCKVLGQLESSNNPKAYNAKENAIGIYQIRLLYFKDAQQFDKSLSNLNHKDCYDPEVSKRVVKAYLERYCRGGTWDEMARCHNGGLNWRKKTGQAKINLDNYVKKFNLIAAQ